MGVGVQRRDPATLPQERAGTHCMGVRGGAVSWGTALQAGSLWVRFPIISFEFLIDIILPAVLGPWSRLAL